MATLEQVEKLREKANVSFEEAKAALEACDNDILEALIHLEQQGRVKEPTGGGSYSNKGAADIAEAEIVRSKSAHDDGGETFGNMMRRLGRFLVKLIRIGNSNYLDVYRKGELFISCPVTLLVVLMIFGFWAVIPLLIVGLFFGFKYSFTGAQLGRESVNKAMDTAASTVADVVSEFKSSMEESKNAGKDAAKDDGKDKGSEEE